MNINFKALFIFVLMLVVALPVMAAPLNGEPEVRRLSDAASISYEFTDGSRLLTTGRDNWNCQESAANWGLYTSPEGITIMADASAKVIIPDMVKTMTINGFVVNPGNQPFIADLPEFVHG